jgi:hypothetical protein
MDQTDLFNFVSKRIQAIAIAAGLLSSLILQGLMEMGSLKATAAVTNP